MSQSGRPCRLPATHGMRGRLGLENGGQGNGGRRPMGWQLNGKEGRQPRKPAPNGTSEQRKPTRRCMGNGGRYRNNGKKARRGPTGNKARRRRLIGEIGRQQPPIGEKGRRKPMSRQMAGNGGRVIGNMGRQPCQPVPPPPMWKKARHGKIGKEAQSELIGKIGRQPAPIGEKWGRK